MRKLFLALTLVALPAVASADDAAMAAKVKAVCEGKYVLTPEARAVCDGGALPPVLKDGTRFRNSGVGAEFNTLIRQLKS